MDRYSRHIALSEVGFEGQEKLTNAKVLVIGAGGLGCPVLQYLAAAGVGFLGIVDHDVVEESNLQRQILYGTSSIGMNKAIAAKKRLTDLNPSIMIQAFSEKLNTSNAISLFEQYDIIVDGTDNFESRYLINDASLNTNKPVVYGAIYKFEGQLSVFNFKNGPSYRCLFPKPPSNDEGINCKEVGVLGVLPGIIGSLQANEVLKIILGIGDVLSGMLYCYNAKTSGVFTTNIEKNNALVKQFKNSQLIKERPIKCNMSVNEITVIEALKFENALFLDVRDFDEKPRIEMDNYQQIPLSKISENLNKIDTEVEIIVLCQSGIRSKNAIQILIQNNFNNCHNLKGGAPALLAQLKHNAV